MKIFGLETTGSFTGNISGSVSSTGSFGTLVADSEYGSLLIGTKTRQSGFDNQIIVEGPNPVLMLKDNTGGNQATQFYTIYSANGIINHYFDHEKSIEFSHTTDIIGNNENIMLKIDANNVEFPYANTKISGSVSSTGSFGQGFIANKLGVGTQSPLTKFHVKEEASSTDVIARLEATGDVYLQFAANNELDWAIIHGYPDTTDFNLYNYSNNRNDITVLDANGNVGIGQTNPANLLQVGDHVHVSGSGLVGIGLAAPEADLHISNASPMIILQDENVSNLKHRIIGGGDAGLELSADINNVGTGYVRFDVANSEAVRIVEGGKVGIGTSNPQEILDVSGSEPSIRIGDSAANKHFNIKVASGGGVSKLRFNSETHDNTLLVTNNNRVGIGAGSPAVNLHLEDSQTDTDFTNNSVVGGSSIIISNQQQTDNTFSSLQFIAKEGGGNDQSAAIVVESTSATTYSPKLHIVQRTASNTQTTRFTIDETGQVGIGTTNPEVALDVVGDVKIKGDLTAETLIISSSVTNLTTQFASGSTRFGDTQDDLHEFTGSLMISGARIDLNDGKNNTGLGKLALASITTGANNVGVGRSAGESLTTGIQNVLLGQSAGLDLTIANYSVAIGMEALRTEDVGDRSVAIGYRSLYSQNSDSNNEDTLNIAIGFQAGYYNVTGKGNVYVGSAAGFGASGNSHSQNTGIGSRVLNVVTTGGNNVGVGYDALKVTTSGTENVAVGKDALKDNQGGSGNTGVGTEALANNTSADDNVAIGKLALFTATTAGLNVAVGNEALRLTTTGGSNVGVGRESGYSGTTHSGSVFIGERAGYEVTTGNQNIAIGHNAMNGGTITGDNNIAIGVETGDALTSAKTNVFMGFQAGSSITTGNENTVVGSRALGTATTATFNVAIGGDAMFGVPSGVAASGVVAVGLEALKGGSNTTTGINNTVAIGNAALKNLSTGTGNVAVGYRALTAATVGSSNVAIGNNTLLSEVGGGGSVAIGTDAMANQDGGDTASSRNNVGIGANAGHYNVTGTNNTLVGNSAGLGASGQSHSNNTAMGYNSLLSITTGGSNVAIGYNAADAMTTGHNNVAIGLGAMGSSENIGYAVAVGSEALNNANAVDDSDSSVAIGNKALYAMVSGIGNVAVGGEALSSEDDGDFNTAVGFQALKDQTGTSGTVGNTAIGYSAGESVLTGKFNTFIGGNAGQKASGSAADENAALGYASLGKLTSGSRNTALGTSAGQLFQNASDIVAVGYYTLANANTSTDIDGSVAIGSLSQAENKTGVGNVSVGKSALQSNVQGDFNTAIGHESLKVVNGVNGQQHNTAVGYQSGLAMSTGKYNVVVGSQAGDAMTSAEGNTAVGFQSLSTNVDGDKNTGVGYRALFAHEPSSDGHGKNTAVGYEAGNDVSTGTSNTIIGAEAGNTGTNDLSSGTLNTLIGADTAVSAADAENQTVIGRAAKSKGDNTFQLGNDATVAWTFGTGSLQTWDTANVFRTIQLGSVTLACQNAGKPQGQAWLTNNLYFDDSNNRFQPIATGESAAINLNDDGDIKFNVSNGSVNAGSEITLVTALDIDNGGVVSGDLNDTSDRNLKKNIVSLSDTTEGVKKLNPVSFDWKHSNDESLGFIAQEVEEIYPELVKNEDGRKSIKTAGIVAVLTKAVQELMEKNKALEKRLEELEAK